MAKKQAEFCVFWHRVIDEDKKIKRPIESLEDIRDILNELIADGYEVSDIFIESLRSGIYGVFFKKEKK